MSQAVVLDFYPELIPLIINQIKTVTYRVGDKYSFLKPGDSIVIRDSINDKIIGEVEITNKSLTIFKDLPLDHKGHESYKSRKEQSDQFKKYYKREIRDSEPITIIEFKLAKVYQ